MSTSNDTTIPTVLLTFELFNNKYLSLKPDVHDLWPPELSGPWACGL